MGLFISKKAILLTFFKRVFCMRLTNDDIIHELKLRLAGEKSIKRKVLLKQIIGLIREF